MKWAVAVGGGGGGGKGGTAPTDLLVCFPARQHLALMPKPICSPSRTTMDKAAAARRRQLPAAGGGHGGRARGSSSPMFRGSSKAKQRAEEEDDEEPQSPKVTCAGQIKVARPKKAKPGPGSTAATTRHGKDGDGRSWITVVEEIERLHGRRRKKVGGSGWLETLGIRRDALPFLGGALRGLRFKARCFGFGSLHAAAAVDTSVVGSDDDGGDGDDEAGERGRSEHGAAAASVFSKWLMVLEGGGQEPLERDEARAHEEERDQEDDVERRQQGEETGEGTNGAPPPPPPNALLLMRCRSAPAKGLSMSRRRTCEQLAGEVGQEKGAADGVPGPGDGGTGTEEDKAELVFMSTAPGFMKLSLDIAKETWVVGGGDMIERCRSWKR